MRIVRVLGAVGVALIAGSAAASAAQESPAYRSADVDLKPKVIEKRLPTAQPPAALVTAPFVVEFVIEPDGTFPNVRITSPPMPDPFTEEYLSILRQWRFEPGRKAGVPVRVAVRLTVSAEAVPSVGRGNTVASKTWKTSWTIDGADDDFGAGAVRIPAPGVTMPRVLKEAKPIYSPDAMRARVSGMVEVEILIGVDGKVGAARVVRSADHRLEEGAMNAARQWVFSPAIRDGQAVPAVVTLSLEFRLAR